MEGLKQQYIFLDMLLESMEENIEVIKIELREAGINPEQSEKNIKYLIKKTKADIRIEKGRELKAKVLDKIKNSAGTILTPAQDNKLAYQFRHLKKLDEDDIKEIKKSELLFSEIEKLIDDEE
jgi:hypothetical protein